MDIVYTTLRTTLTVIRGPPVAGNSFLNLIEFSLIITLFVEAPSPPLTNLITIIFH